MREHQSDGILMDVAAGAAFLGISERALRARIARRQIPFRRFHGRVVLVRSELEAFINRLRGCSLDDALSKVHDCGDK